MKYKSTLWFIACFLSYLFLMFSYVFFLGWANMYSDGAALNLVMDFTVTIAWMLYGITMAKYALSSINAQPKELIAHCIIGILAFFFIRNMDNFLSGTAPYVALLIGTVFTVTIVNILKNRNPSPTK